VIEARPLPLWLGRSAALLGILLMALNLRTAVAAISPITAYVATDIPLDSVSLGLLGALPPIAFAICGLVAPRIAHRFGLEVALLVASVAMVVGHLARAFAGSYAILLASSVVVLAGMGFGNILLPPTVKRYFPDRIGLVTTSYVTLMSFSTAVPALVAAPIAVAAGWRVSLGVWAFFSVGALVPWVIVKVQHRRDARAAVGQDEAPELADPAPALVRGLKRSRTAWALTIIFSVSALSAYAMFAWLPAILVQTAGLAPLQAGALLSLFGLMGLPAALAIPILATRMRNVGLLVYAGVVSFLLGYLGLVVAPAAAPVLWVILAGAGPLLFPVALVLINLRTRSHQASIALSGFVQSIGYAVGAVGPIIVGILRDLTQGWTAALIFLMVVALAGAVAGVMLTRTSFVEDELS
jgi:CP family cyanate transporter-like MFS transporter